MWDLDLSLLAPRALQGKESPRDRQSGRPTLCKERKGWATQGLCSVKVGHPRSLFQFLVGCCFAASGKNLGTKTWSGSDYSFAGSRGAGLGAAENSLD